MTTNPEELSGTYNSAQNTMNPEDVFEGDILPVEYDLKITTNVVEGEVEGFEGFPTAQSMIDVPPHDTWLVDEVFKYAAIDRAVGLNTAKPLLFPLTTNVNARVTHLAKMWTYSRSCISMKFDAKLPLGAAARVKVVAMPGFVTTATNEAVLSFPGVIWDLTEKPSITIKVDWILPEYLLPVGEAYSTVAITVLGMAMKTDETPEPLLITPTYIVDDVLFAVRTHVRQDETPDPPTPQPTDANPTHGVGVVAEQVRQVTRVWNEYSKQYEVRDVWTWIYKIVGLVASTVGELIFPGSGEVVMLGVDLIWILFDLKSEDGVRIDVGELMEVSVAKGTPIKIVQIGEFMGVEIGGPMFRGFLTRGDPEDPELIRWVDPSVAAKMIPLNSMPRANTAVVPLAAAIPAAVTMNINGGGLGVGTGAPYYKFVKGAGAGLMWDNSRAILYGDDGDDYQWDLFDAPKGNRHPSSWNVLRNIEQEGSTYKGLTIGFTLGFFPKGWKRGDPPASIFSPFVNENWSGTDVNVDVMGLIHATGIRNARIYPCFAVSDTDYTTEPPVKDGAPFSFIAPVRYSLTSNQFVPLYVNLSSSTGGAWQGEATRNGVGMITVVNMAASLTTAEKDAGLNFAGLMALTPTGDSATRFIEIEEWTKDTRPLEPPIKTEASDKVAGQKTNFNTWPENQARGYNSTNKKPLKIDCTCAEWGTRCPHLRMLQDDVESDIEYDTVEEHGPIRESWESIKQSINHMFLRKAMKPTYTWSGNGKPRVYTKWPLIERPIIPIDNFDLVHEQGPGDVGVKVQSAKVGGIASNIHLNAPTQPLGSVNTRVTADEMWSPVDIDFKIPLGNAYVLPINVRNAGPVGAIQPTHFQVEPLRHAYTGPKPGEKSWGKFRISTVTNAYVNGRLLIIHIPGHIPASDIAKMTAEQLMQYPRVEHELKGGDTEFSPKWTLPLPYMVNNSNQANGHLVLRWAEYSISGTSSEPSISIWINPEGCQHSIIVPHATYVPRMTRMIVGERSSAAEQARYVNRPPRINFSNPRDLHDVLAEISHALRNPSEGRANLGPFTVGGAPERESHPRET